MLWFCIVIAYQVNVLHAEIFFPLFFIIWIYPKFTFFSKNTIKEYYKRAKQFESRSSPTNIPDYFWHVAIFFQLIISKINFFRKQSKRKSQLVWVQIRPDWMSGPILIQSVYKGYQQKIFKSQENAKFRSFSLTRSLLGTHISSSY